MFNLDEPLRQDWAAVRGMPEVIMDLKRGLWEVPRSRFITGRCRSNGWLFFLINVAICKAH